MKNPGLWIVLAGLAVVFTAATSASDKATPEQLQAMLVAGAIMLMVGTMYFLPTLIAHARKKANIRPIFLVNFIAGWTVIGWIIALMWAFTADTPGETKQTVRSAGGSFCPQCGRGGQAGSRFCVACGATIT